MELSCGPLIVNERELGNADMAPVSAGKKEKERLRALRFPDGGGTGKEPLRWEFPSRGSCCRDGEGGWRASVVPGPENKPSGEHSLPEGEKTVRYIACCQGKRLYRPEGPSMIALWLMFQPPPRAVYRETSVLACW